MLYDIDFTKDPKYVPGYTKAPERMFAAKFSDNIKVIPNKDWKPLAETISKKGGICQRLITRIYNQKNEGSCVSNAYGQAHEICQARQLGKQRVTPVSAISLYKRCGSSPNSGSSVDDTWDELTTRGILPLNTEFNIKHFQHTMPATGFYTPFPSGWELTAKLFIGMEGFIVESPEEFVSALLQGYCVVYGRSGHCIVAVEWQYDSNGVGVAKYANSWDVWGVAGGDFSYGFGYDSYSMISRGSDWAVAIRQVKTPQIDLGIFSTAS